MQTIENDLIRKGEKIRTCLLVCRNRNSSVIRVRFCQLVTKTDVLSSHVKHPEAGDKVTLHDSMRMDCLLTSNSSIEFVLLAFVIGLAHMYL